MATALKDATKPATKRRASKSGKATPAAIVAAKPQPGMLAPSTITTVRYIEIERAEENVRRTDKAADVESLADDIAAHGLLQSLIGYRWPGAISASAGGKKNGIHPVCIVGGGRRLQALELLHERGIIDDEWPVPVLIRDRADAIELSLSENLARRDMNPADEFTAFAALMKPGSLSTTDLAKRFGFTEQYIKQRLRLAALADDVLAALRDGKLSLQFALEYAKTSDRALQSKVFTAIAKGPAYNRDSIWSIRSGISADQLTEDSAIFQFIDRATYEKEGGGYDEDLFADLHDGEGRKLADGHLARTIATRCLEFQAARVVERAKRDYPTIDGSVTTTSLLADGPASAPKGYVEIRGGWIDGQHVDVQTCWKRAREQSVPIQIAVGITREEPIGEDDDRSPLAWTAGYAKHHFFVPKDSKAKVIPPAEPTTYGDNRTPEQRAAAELEQEARLWAARLAVPRFSDIPEFDGRVFYNDNYLAEHRIKPGDPASGDRTPSFAVNVFVSEAEIAAHLDVGREQALEIRAEREARKAEREAAKLEVEQAKEAKHAELAALDPPPEVLLDANGNLWVKTPDGWTVEDEEDEVGYAAEFADLLEQLDPDDVIAWWMTRAEHEAGDSATVDRSANAEVNAG